MRRRAAQRAAGLGAPELGAVVGVRARRHRRGRRSRRRLPSSIADAAAEARRGSFLSPWRSSVAQSWRRCRRRRRGPRASTSIDVQLAVGDHRRRGEPLRGSSRRRSARVQARVSVAPSASWPIDFAALPPGCAQSVVGVGRRQQHLRRRRATGSALTSLSDTRIGTRSPSTGVLLAAALEHAAARSAPAAPRSPTAAPVT